MRVEDSHNDDSKEREETYQALLAPAMNREVENFLIPDSERPMNADSDESIHKFLHPENTAVSIRRREFGVNQKPYESFA